jgi:DNA-binding LytR/AlgR family response regulator
MKNTDLHFTSDAIIIRESYKVICLPYHDILFFHLNASYITIGLIKEKSLLIRSSLSLILKSLPGVFVLCNRTTIVNQLYVKTIEDEKSVILSNGESFILSRRKQDVFIDHYLHLRKRPRTCCKCFCCNHFSSCESDLKNVS